MPEIYEPCIGDRELPQMIDFAGIDLRGGLLVRTPNWLGDAVMALPGIHRLKRLLPSGCGLFALCPEKLGPLWRACRWVDEIVTFPGKRVDAAAAARLEALDPGASVVLPNSFGAAFDLWRRRLPNLIGRTGRGRGWLLDYRLPGWRRATGVEKLHQARHYLEIAVACGCREWNFQCPPLAPVLSEEAVKRLARQTAGASYLVIAPGAAYGPAKQWPPTCFNQVAKWWAAEHGMVVAVGAPGEEATAKAALADCPYGLNLAGKTDLGELMYLLGNAAAALVNDSGAMHLAAAMGGTGVAVFGSTNPLATGPLGGRWVVLQRPLYCSPCLQRVCPRTDSLYECLVTIQPSRAIEVLQSITPGGPA